MNNEAKRQKLQKDESDDDEELPPLVDSEVSDDEIPPLLIDSSSDDGDDELPPLLEESDDDELPPLVDSEASSESDDDMPKLIDSDSDENWEDVSDEDDDDDEDDWEDVSDEDDEDKGCAEHYLGDDRVTVYDRVTHLEALPPLVSPSSSEDENSDEDSDEEISSSSSDDDVNFPLFMPSSSRATNQRGGHRPGLSNILNRQRIRARPPASFLFNSSDEDDVDIDESDEDDESEDEAFGNPRVIDSQGILHSSSRSGTHNRYWTQISAVEKSKLDTLYRNTEESFKFNTAQSSSSFNESPLISIPIGNGLQLSIHNMEEFLDGIIQVITSHSLRAMEVSSLFEYSRLSQKQVVQNRNILLLLALMLAIKIRYMKD